MTCNVLMGTLNPTHSTQLNFVNYSCNNNYVGCSSQDVGDANSDRISTEEFYASLRKTAADIEMLNNFD